MSRFIGLIFQDEGTATEALHALKELEASRSIAISGMAMVEKDANGTISLKSATDEGPIATLVGALIGGLAGLGGGPVGVPIAAAGGAMLGHAADRINLGEREKFAAKVSRAMNPGSIAVLVEMTEYSESSFDSRTKELGGTVLWE
jgi:uncharacterized membrane protein